MTLQNIMTGIMLSDGPPPERERPTVGSNDHDDQFETVHLLLVGVKKKKEKRKKENKKNK